MKNFVMKLLIMALLICAAPINTLAEECPKPTLQNVSKEPWTEYDKSILELAQKRCPELHPDAPCVVLFRKFDVQQYTVICGRQRGDAKNYIYFKN